MDDIETSNIVEAEPSYSEAGASLNKTVPSTAEAYQAWAGIDVSKATLDVCLLLEVGKPAFGKFSNDKQGHSQLFKWAVRLSKGSRVHFCMEATGSYGNAFALYLADVKQMVSVVNPSFIHYWTLSRSQGNKTDKADARAIAEYCRIEKPSLWHAAAPEVRELTALVRHYDNLKEHATQLTNRLGGPDVTSLVKESLTKLLKQVNDEISIVQKLIDEHINNSPTLKRDRDLLITIPGIAATTAAKILAELPEVTQFNSAASAAKYAGMTPSQFESGTSVRKKTRMFKAGNRRLKTALYMPAMTAIRYNEPVKQIFQRLKGKGHTGISALGAAMRKLLMIAVGVLRTQQPFRADYATAKP